jgi:hypothetical protein
MSHDDRLQAAMDEVNELKAERDALAARLAAIGKYWGSTSGVSSSSNGHHAMTLYYQTRAEADAAWDAITRAAGSTTTKEPT